MDPEDDPFFFDDDFLLDDADNFAPNILPQAAQNAVPANYFPEEDRMSSRLARRFYRFHNNSDSLEKF